MSAPQEFQDRFLAGAAREFVRRARAIRYEAGKLDIELGDDADEWMRVTFQPAAPRPALVLLIEA